MTLSSHPTHKRIITACSGLNTISSVLEECRVVGPEIKHYLARKMHVRRGDLDLGTLMYVRQAYHTWKMNMDATAGTGWRRRTGDKSKVVAAGERKINVATGVPGTDV